MIAWLSTSKELQIALQELEVWLEIRVTFLGVSLNVNCWLQADYFPLVYVFLTAASYFTPFLSNVLFLSF